MKAILLSLIGLMLYLCSDSSAQSQQTGRRSMFLTDALKGLSKTYRVNFLYEQTSLTSKTISTGSQAAKGEKLSDILPRMLTAQGLSWYEIDHDNYAVYPAVKNNSVSVSASIQPVQSPGASDSTGASQLRGRIWNEQHQAQQFATVSLVRLPDSLIIYNTLSDTAGTYLFRISKAGNYFVKASTIGYKTANSKAFEVSSTSGRKNLEPIVMELLPHSLKAVQITGNRPLIETKSDRFILNVENSAMASGSSIQLLKSAPFVQVSPDNTVMLQGKKTLVLIDNKQVPDDALENILKTLPAGNISKIELITHPSAKYDAAYGAVINVITKKSQVEGLTGSVRADGSQGIYAEGSVNGSLTYKHRSLTLFSTINYTKGDNLFQVTSDRTFNTASSPEVLTNDWIRLSHNNLYSFQLGAELGIGKNHTIGILINPNIYRFSGPWTTVNTFHRQGFALDSVLHTNANFYQKAATGSYNVNYHLLADSGKNELTVLATYTPFSRDLRQSFPSVLTDGAENVIRVPNPYQTINTAAIGVYIGQLDYSYQFKNQWKLESGLKYQTTASRAEVDYQVSSNGQFMRVPAYSSDNHLKESISGAYGILSKNWKTGELQLGLRMENTKASLAGAFDQNYFNAFPTLLVQHNFKGHDNLSFTYRQTINRAPYFELVPYTVFINAYTVEQGNPALRPEYDHIFSLNANIHKLNLSLSYTAAQGLIALFPIHQDYATGVTYFSRRNLDHSSDLSLYVYFPLSLTPWWETQNSGTAGGYNSVRGQVLGSSYTLDAFHSDFKSAHIFKFSKNVKLEIDAYYWTPYVQDLSRQSGYKNLDASLLISVLAGKGQLRLGGNQIVFKRNDYRITHDFNGYSSRELINTDSRRVSAGFTYNFGKTKIKSPDKKLGNEDAVKRL